MWLQVAWVRSSARRMPIARWVGRVLPTSIAFLRARRTPGGGEREIDRRECRRRSRCQRSGQQVYRGRSVTSILATAVEGLCERDPFDEGAPSIHAAGDNGRCDGDGMCITSAELVHSDGRSMRVIDMACKQLSRMFW